MNKRLRDFYTHAAVLEIDPKNCCLQRETRHFTGLHFTQTTAFVIAATSLRMQASICFVVQAVVGMHIAQLVTYWSASNHLIVPPAERAPVLL